MDIHDQVLVIFDNPNQKYHHNWMDNIYNYSSFCKDAWNHQNCFIVLVMTRKGLRGIPACIMQYECTKPIDAGQD